MVHPYPQHPGMWMYAAYPPPYWQAWPRLTDPRQWNPARPEIGRPETGMRFLARFLDTIFFGIIWFAMMLVGTFISSALETNGYLETSDTAFMVAFVFNFFVLPIVLEWLQMVLWGRSLGKMLLGLWVVRADGGGKVTAGRALVRALLYAPGHTNLVNLFLPWSITNLLWQFRDKDFRRCLHDKAAGTVVIQLHH